MGRSQQRGLDEEGGIKSGGHAPLVLCSLVSVNSIWDGRFKNAFWSDGLRLIRCHTCKTDRLEMPQILHVHICLGSVNLQDEKKFLQTMNVVSPLN